LKNKKKNNMTKAEIKKTIQENVTLQIASDWYSSAEKLMHFDDGFNSQYLELCCTNDDEKFDYALELFESECERLLTEMLEKVLA